MTDDTKVEVGISEQPTDEQVKQLREQSWYREFSDELRAEIVETEFNINTTAITLNYSVGKQIAEKVVDFDRSKIYGKHIVKILAQDIKRSTGGIYFALQFFEAVPNLDEWLPKQPKHIKWNHICKSLPKMIEAKRKGEEPVVEIGPIKKKEGEEKGEDIAKPEIRVEFNKELELWDIKIKREDFPVINLLGFKKEIDDFFAEQSTKV